MESDCVRSIQQICSNYLNDPWSSNDDLIEVTQISGGFANQTYRCSLKHKFPHEDDVVVKLYGSKFSENFDECKENGVAAEALIFYILSQNNLAAKLLAVFDNGRIEQCVNGRNLTVIDFKEKSLLREFACKLAKFHQISAPIAKNKDYLKRLRKKFDGIECKDWIQCIPENEQANVVSLFQFPLIQEIDLMVSLSEKLDSTIVFSHNDAHNDNLLLRTNPVNQDDRILMMDFEMSGYNYRGFDIGFFLMQTQLQYNFETHEQVIEISDEYDEMKRYFVEHYLHELRKMKVTLNANVDTVDHLIMEAEFFSLQFFLIDFGFLKGLLATDTYRTAVRSFKFVNRLIEFYFNMKEEVFSKYSHIIS